ncbi:MAG: hypothetical protein HRT66_10765 [Flavobacteriaceae bacterium]|nr:hypothetical protein [Flavobacteriaceae bacterium]
METIITITKLLLIILLVGVPFWILKKTKGTKYRFFKYIIPSTILTSAVILFSVWWAHYSIGILLSHYEYLSEPMIPKERFINVSTENMYRVNQLIDDWTGVGWPFKAILFSIVYFPILIFIFFFNILFVMIKDKWIKSN